VQLQDSKLEARILSLRLCFLLRSFYIFTYRRVAVCHRLVCVSQPVTDEVFQCPLLAEPRSALASEAMKASFGLFLRCQGRMQSTSQQVRLRQEIPPFVLEQESCLPVAHKLFEH
jgi:hypothetical protein